MSLFDINDILNQTIREANTKRKLLAAGEYTAFVSDVKVVERRNQDGDEVPVIDLRLTLDVPYDQQEVVGRETVDLTDSIWLETTASGSIDMGAGKNGRMKAWRDSTDMNRAGEDFRFSMLVGKRVKVKVKPDVSKKTGEPFEKIDGVTHA